MPTRERCQRRNATSVGSVKNIDPDGKPEHFCRNMMRRAYAWRSVRNFAWLGARQRDQSLSEVQVRSCLRQLPWVTTSTDQSVENL